MRRFYFSVFIFFILLLFGGIFYFNQDFSEVLEKANQANLQAQLVEIKRQEVKRAAKLIEERTATLIFVGDIMLSRAVAWQIKKNGNDFKYPFLKIAEVLRSADITFGNLEGPISDRGKNLGSIYSFRADPRVIEGLTFAGFDVLSLANNHIWDWGELALSDTIDILKKHEIRPVGVGQNEAETNQPVVFNVRGTSIAFLAYTNLLPKSLEAVGERPGLSHFDLEIIKNNIVKIRPLVDLIVVSFHWGEEYKSHSAPQEQDIAHAIIGASADLIIGHHPHIIQEIEQYKNGWIAYSLGNFIFDQNTSEETMRGLMLEVKVRDKKIVALEPIEIRINQSFQSFIPEL